MIKRGILVLLIFSVILMQGCSKSNGDFQGRRDFSGERPFPGGMNRSQLPGGNLSEEERQQMFEERQQEMVEACTGKSEGDSCVIESPRGSTEGKCNLVDDNLACAFDRPEMQR